MKVTRGIFPSGVRYEVNEIGQKEDEDGFRTPSFTKYIFRILKMVCVSVKITGDSVMVRDTKDPTKTTLTFDHDEWAAFINGVKAGEFDLPVKAQVAEAA